MVLPSAIAIALCFMGVLIAPDLAIHSARDNVEQGLAGDWRGMFRHKNDLAPMAIHFVFAGILLWRTSSRFWGGLVIAGAMILLVMSGGKSASLLLFPALLGAALIVRLDTPRPGQSRRLHRRRRTRAADPGLCRFPRYRRHRRRICRTRPSPAAPISGCWGSMPPAPAL